MIVSILLLLARAEHKVKASTLQAVRVWMGHQEGGACWDQGELREVEGGC
jgi:hypothetical protein